MHFGKWGAMRQNTYLFTEFVTRPIETENDVTGFPRMMGSSCQRRRRRRRVGFTDGGHYDGRETISITLGISVFIYHSPGGPGRLMLIEQQEK